MNFELIRDEDEAKVLRHFKKLAHQIDEANKTDDKQLFNYLCNYEKSIIKYMKYKEQIVATMVHLEFAGLISRILVDAGLISMFSSDRDQVLARVCLDILLNLTDTDKRAGLQVIQTEGVVNLLVKTINNKSFHFLFFEQMYGTLFVTTAIVQNIARHPDLVTCFRRNDLKKSLLYLTGLDAQSKLGISATLALCAIVDDNDKHLLEKCKKYIKSLLNMITSSIRDPNCRYEGYSTWELINGLRNMSVNDSMKSEIFEQNGAKLLSRVLLDIKCDDLSAEMALGTLCNLCFDQKVLKSLDGDECNIQEIISKYEKSKIPNIKRITEIISWKIDRNIQQETSKQRLAYLPSEPEKRDWQYDAFISYSSDNKEIIYKILEGIRSMNPNMKIWIDKEQMRGSTLDAMANGIENSKLFLMCVSESYRQSENCQLETEYAHKRKKRIIPIKVQCKYEPSGSIGMIMGQKKYYEFSERREFKTSLSALVNDISMGHDVDSVTKEYTLDLNQASNDDHPVTSVGSRSIVESWSKCEVETWLDKSKLNKLKEKLSKKPNINGELLCSMFHMHKDAPDFFYKSLKKEYEMDLDEIASLKLAIDKLEIE